MSNSGVNQPQYKVGDIVNGHILTAQNEWQPVAQAPGVPSAPAAPVPAQEKSEKPKRKWFLKKRVLIPAGILALIIFVNSVNGSSGSDEAGSAKEPASVAVDDEAEAAEAPAAEEEPPAEEPAAAASGTAANPLPQPYVAKGLMGGEKYSLTGRVVADGADVVAWNMFNDPAPAGFKWVIVELSMTGIDKDGVEPSLASFDLSLSTPEGNQYSEETVVLGDGMARMYEGPTLYPGSVYTGHMSFLVPEAAAGFMLHDNGNYVIL